MVRWQCDKGEDGGEGKYSRKIFPHWRRRGEVNHYRGVLVFVPSLRLPAPMSSPISKYHRSVSFSTIGVNQRGNAEEATSRWFVGSFSARFSLFLVSSSFLMPSIFRTAVRSLSLNLYLLFLSSLERYIQNWKSSVRSFSPYCVWIFVCLSWIQY